MSEYSKLGFTWKDIIHSFPSTGDIENLRFESGNY